VQVAAGALASVSAAVLASLFGVAGTMIGAALASVVSTVGAAIYSDSLRRTHAGIRRVRPLLRRGQTEGRPAGAGSLPPLPARLNPRRSSARRWRRRSILAGTAVGVFGLAIGVVTAVELIGHEPVSALVGGSGHAGGTTIGTLTEAIGGGQPRPAPAAPDITVPGPSTAGSPPASGSSPTPTASRESAAADASASTSASDGAASTASSPASSAGNGTGPAAPTQAADASSAAASPPAAASTAPAKQSDTGAGQAPPDPAPSP